MFAGALLPTIIRNPDTNYSSAPKSNVWGFPQTKRLGVLQFSSDIIYLERTVLQDCPVPPTPLDASHKSRLSPMLLANWL